MPALEAFTGGIRGRAWRSPLFTCTSTRGGIDESAREEVLVAKVLVNE